MLENETMGTKIEREDIISNEAIKNVARLSYEIDKLDRKLENLAKKYGISKRKVWKELFLGGDFEIDVPEDSTDINTYEEIFPT